MSPYASGSQRAGREGARHRCLDSLHRASSLTMHKMLPEGVANWTGRAVRWTVMASAADDVADGSEGDVAGTDAMALAAEEPAEGGPEATTGWFPAVQPVAVKPARMMPGQRLRPMIMVGESQEDECFR